MCRFIAYLGRPIMVDELLLKPENSLVHQSFNAGEMSEPLNGDGFGLGWYDHDLKASPGLFRSITPAWNNQNLLHNASMFRANCLFAHIRSATEGMVSEANSHPFAFQGRLMMHNGYVPEFPRIKRALIQKLDDDLFLWIQGQTDSEHLFALLMQQIRNLQGPATKASPEVVQQAFQNTFDLVRELTEAAGIGDQTSAFNMMITDGRHIYGTRYSTNPEDQNPTLYCASGSHFEVNKGIGRMVVGGQDKGAVLIVSEKLSDNEEAWTPVPSRSFIAVEPGMTVTIRPMQ